MLLKGDFGSLILNSPELCEIDTGLCRSLFEGDPFTSASDCSFKCDKSAEIVPSFENADDVESSFDRVLVKVAADALASFLFGSRLREDEGFIICEVLIFESLSK